GPETAVMMAASNRSLSCQSWLVTWKGNTLEPSGAMRPENAIFECDVATRLSANVMPPGSNVYSRLAPMASGVLRGLESNGWGSNAATSGTSGKPSGASGGVPGSGVMLVRPEPRRPDDMLPFGQARDSVPSAVPASRRPRSPISRSSSNSSTPVYEASKLAVAGFGVP